MSAMLAATAQLFVMLLSSAIETFLSTVDSVNGAYLDANAGFHAFREQISSFQSNVSASTGLALGHLDGLRFTYGIGDPNVAGAQVQHEVTQGKLKERNSKNGENALFLGSMCVVAIYQFWEDRFRAEIARELSVEREALKDDLLGDVRLIRIAIVHYGGVAKVETERCNVLKWFRAGDRIEITEERMHEIVTRLRRVCCDWMGKRDDSKATNA